LCTPFGSLSRRRLQVSCLVAFPGPFTLLGIFFRRLDARRRFNNVVSCGLPGLMYALCMEYELASRSSASVRLRRDMESRGSSPLCMKSFGVGTRGAARRLFASVLSCGIPRLICAIDCLVFTLGRLSSQLSSFVCQFHIVCYPSGHV
jgi:hypothetical protein